MSVKYSDSGLWVECSPKLQYRVQILVSQSHNCEFPRAFSWDVGFLSLSPFLSLIPLQLAKLTQILLSYFLSLSQFYGKLNKLFPALSFYLKEVPITLVDILFIELMLHLSHVKQMFSRPIRLTHELILCFTAYVLSLINVT